MIRAVEITIIGVLLFFLCSPWFGAPFALLPNPLLRGEIILITALTYFGFRYQRQTVLALSIVAPLLCIFLFFVVSDGRLISSDDHSTFLYRLTLLKRHFPNIPFYGPLWNAGIDVRDFFATGALNVFFLSSPLLIFSDPSEVYNIIVVGLLFGLLPLSTFIGGRLHGLQTVGAGAASVLALSTSLLWYRWALQYGTLGFVTSASLIPLNAGLASLFFKEKYRIPLWVMALTACSVTLMLFWSPTGIVFIPVIVLAVIYAPTVFRRRGILLLLGLLLCLNLPWISLFWHASNVSSFLVSETIEKEVRSDENSTAKRRMKAAPTHFSLEEDLKELKEVALSAHPLLLILPLLGVAFLKRESAQILGALLAWLFILGFIISPLKPQLELDRMLLIFLLVGAVPAGKLIEMSLARSRYSLSARFCGAFCLAFLVAGIMGVGTILLGRSPIPISYDDQARTKAFTDIIRSEGDRGRILFSGFLLHEFNGGHFAPLAAFTGKPLLASSQLHNLWWYKQIFPDWALKKKDEGIQSYLDLYNVSGVFAHEPLWRRYFRERPEEYTEIWQFLLLSRIFQRNPYPHSYFYSGSGQVLEQEDSFVRVRVDSETATLRFHYYPFLTTNDCSIGSETVAPDIHFIRLTDCTPGTELIIKSVSPFRRIFPRRKQQEEK